MAYALPFGKVGLAPAQSVFGALALREITNHFAETD
jgi:hypothetical protein